jgi:hypothetical protein
MGEGMVDDRGRVLAGLAALVDEMCETRQHMEPIWEYDRHRNRRMRRVHTTMQPGLLAQLAEAMTDASTGWMEAGRSVPDSQPPGSWEALATHAGITTEVTRWCWELGVPIRRTVEHSMRALVGYASVLDDTQLARLAADVRRWRHQAAVMTGWQRPLFAPRVPCPVCETLGTLRINVDRQVAVCTNHDRDERDQPVCGAAWDETTIGVLADYIRARVTSEAA